METSEQKNKPKQKLNHIWSFFGNNKVDSVVEKDVNKDTVDMRKTEYQSNKEVQKESTNKTKEDDINGECEKDSNGLNGDDDKEAEVNRPGSLSPAVTMNKTAKAKDSDSHNDSDEYSTDIEDDEESIGDQSKQDDDGEDMKDNTKSEYQNLLTQFARRSSQIDAVDPTADFIDTVKQGNTIFFVSFKIYITKVSVRN